MSVITVGEATPNRVEIIARAVAARGEAGIQTDELRRLLGPDAASNSVVVPRALSETISLGLVREERGQCFPGTDLPADDAEAFRTHLAALLLDPDRADERQKDVPFALAWLLEQEPTRPIRFTGDNVPELVKQQCGDSADEIGLTNEDPRWHQLTYWACYLGYAWRLKYSAAVTAVDFLVPDPTEALARVLLPLLQERGELPIREARDIWAVASPVLDGGTARRHVHSLFREPTYEEQTTLSASTSLALRRLEDRRRLRLFERADAPTMVLQLGQARRPVSHLLEVKAS